MSEMAMVENGGQYSVMMLEDMSTFTFDNSHMNFSKLIQAYNDRDSDAFKDLSNVGKVINDSLSETDHVEIVDGAVFVDGEPVDNRVCDKIIQFYEAGIDYEPLVKFLLRLQKNPSKRSVDQLFLFLEHENIAIGSDGRFMAYKAVQSNYKDKHSGKVDNSVGAICSMSRNKVDDDPSSHCSHGFHVGSLAYSGPDGWFTAPGDRVLIVAVDPEHAVSVPTDHSNQKLRVCEYEVMGEYDRPLGIVEDNEVYDEDEDWDCIDCEDEDEDEEDPSEWKDCSVFLLYDGQEVSLVMDDGSTINGEVNSYYPDWEYMYVGFNYVDFDEIVKCKTKC